MSSTTSPKKDDGSSAAVRPSHEGSVRSLRLGDSHLETGSRRGDSFDDDEARLAALGYKSDFKREFKSLSTISFAFSIMGLISSVATTFNSPFSLGGPASVVWTWLIGSIMNLCLGTAIAELVSAYPSNGGLYTASARVVPRKYRARVAWVTGWLNLTGQIAGIAGTEFGLSQMIWAYVSVAKGGYNVSSGELVGVYIGLLVIHGLLNCFGTKFLARMTSGYVFVNLGITLVTIITLLAMTPRNEMHSAAYTFGNIQNGSGWSSNGLAFLFGLYCVQFVMTDYDATAHISEEVKRAAVAAPVAIFVAVAGTGLAGFILNIVVIICSGDVINGSIDTWQGGLAFAEILYERTGQVGFLVIWPFICAVAFFVVTTALQANARSFYAFSRDGGMPDRGFFAKMNRFTQTPVNAVWLVVLGCIAMGCLDFASYIAVEAIFALAAVGMDSSYLIPIVCRQIWQDHPDVQFEPGPFTLGRGKLSRFVNITAALWTAFECIILILPTTLPVDKSNMNYAIVITGGVLIITGLWYFFFAHRWYTGPRSNIDEDTIKRLGVADRLADGVAPVVSRTSVAAATEKVEGKSKSEAH